jgi:hypothetical protein
MAAPVRVAGGARRALLAALWALVAQLQFAGVAGNRYLIASFPTLHMVQYAKVDNPTWLPLINGALGLTTPQALAVDHTNNRLFVYDAAQVCVLFYSLTVLADGRLVTDGHKSVAIGAMTVSGIAIDHVGSLYVSGRSMPMPPLTPSYGIFKQDAVAIATIATGVAAAPPRQIWSRTNTADTSTPDSPQLFEPTGIALDPFNVYWANRGRKSATGSVVKANREPPAVQPEKALHPMSDNVESVNCIVLTPLNVFYGAQGAVYAVPVAKSGGSCGGDGSQCPKVAVAGQLDPTGMVWDGDGTIYVADNGRGGIYGLPSGSATAHELELVVAATGVHSIGYLDSSPSAAQGHGSSARSAVLGALVAAVLAGLAPL